ncbi:hypothetical protein CHS0354_033351 [Potamilus streckersoni]|uniref:Uncharacterized protein n=1 Tax=Potamilus streckersoni TaxID=2493646 RepID=A0AAE0RTL4_9BIVA|nr:hypothetical protein CHS0354_033351 [Potamilus streckersoni]
MGTQQPPHPQNASEWQLYHVLQRANLLQYFETFIAQGGDDVQQLCEAGEEEFLEIMALVGMASKPLHVRRLQKSLQEWVANPAAFQAPSSSIIPTTLPGASINPVPPAVTVTTHRQEQSNLGPVFPVHSASSNLHVNSPWASQISSMVKTRSSTSPSSLSGAENSSGCINSIPQLNQLEKAASASSSPLPTPVLLETQIHALAEAAARLAKTLPSFEAKKMNMKKPISREIQMVMQMTDEDSNRMEELRKYAAIYGRFDSKRKNERPMSLHEISVNEAAAQLCRHIPTLMTRREDLFPLARQVVRDSGYHYSKGHSRASEQLTLPSAKRPRLDLSPYHNGSENLIGGMDSGLAEGLKDRLAAINKELSEILVRQEEIKQEIEDAQKDQNPTLVQQLETAVEQITSKHLLLLNEQREILRKQSASMNFSMGDNSLNDSYDSNFQSGSSSGDDGDSRDADDDKLKLRLTTKALLNSASREKLVQESLFDEGLRIAQQYGMSDFAKELQQLQGTNPNPRGRRQIGLKKTNGASFSHSNEVKKSESAEKSADDYDSEDTDGTESTEVKQEVQES